MRNYWGYNMSYVMPDNQMNDIDRLWEAVIKLQRQITVLERRIDKGGD